MNGFQIGTKRLKVQHKRIGSVAEGDSQQIGNTPYSGFESRSSENKQYNSGVAMFEYAQPTNVIQNAQDYRRLS